MCLHVTLLSTFTLLQELEAESQARSDEVQQLQSLLAHELLLRETMASTQVSAALARKLASLCTVRPGLQPHRLCTARAVYPFGFKR
jgi:hypothetical protein